MRTKPPNIDVFMSWSGDRSQMMATALKDFLSDILGAESWLSEHIPGGDGWFNGIQQRLDTATYGVLCLTTENTKSTWIHFEAGAIGKHYEKNFAISLLLDLKATDLDRTHPLSQLQCFDTRNKDSMFSFLERLNNKAEDPAVETRLRRLFERCWPDLENSLDKARKNGPTKPTSQRNPDTILESIETDVRQIQHTVKNMGLGVGSGITSDPALDPALDKLRKNEFLRVAFLRLGNYTTLFDRVEKNKGQKEELAKFFWKHCFWGIFGAKPPIHQIFFESGSTLAYVANTFLDQIQEQPAWQKNFLPTIHITTNNLLVFMQYLFNKELAPRLELRPQGRPDTRYGATYGKLDDLVPYPPPLDQPLSDHVQAHMNDIASQITSPALGL